MPFISASVISPYNSIRGGAEGGLVPLLLDLYPNAAAAYSLRKLRTAYSGPAIEARRSDNAIQDIGFLYDGSLDTESLLSFADGGDVFVAKWYDQSGNENNDVVQVSESAQPKIVSLGNLVEENGKPSIYFDGNVNLQSLNNTNYGTSSRSLFLSSKLDGDINGIISLTDVDTGIGSVWIITPELATRTRVYVWVSSTELPSTNLGIVSNIYTSGQLFEGNSMWLNGNDVVRTSGTNGAINTSIGKLTVGGNGFGFNVTAFISESIIYQSDQTANRAGIEANINKNYNIYWDGSQTGLLDDYPNASAAYSLRALNSTYTGPAIEARKAVGSETFVQDIGFLYDGSLDTASLLSFAEGGDVFVAKWYDQSGEGNDIAQISQSAQPQIVSNGVVVTTSGNYAVDFTSSTKYLVNATLNNSTAIGSVFTLLKSASSLGTQIVTDSNDSSVRQVSGYYGAGPSVFNIFKGIVTRSQTPHNTNLNLLSTFFDVKSDLYLNGVKIIDTLNAGTNNRQGFTLGSGVNGAVPFNGVIFEVIIFDEQNKSSDRVGIETNINNHYTIYP